MNLLNPSCWCDFAKVPCIRLVLFCFIHPGNISSYGPGVLVRRNPTACQAMSSIVGVWEQLRLLPETLGFSWMLGTYPKHLPQNLYKKAVILAVKALSMILVVAVVNNMSILTYIYSDENYCIWYNSETILMKQIYIYINIILHVILKV